MPQVLEYRFARDGDVDAAGRLIAHSFPGLGRPPEWWSEQLRDPRYGGSAGDTLLLGFEEERMVAACQIHPLRQWIAGECLPMAGVGSVAVSPTHRRRSLAAELVAEALLRARERGDLCSALYPFRVAFYQRLGYGNAGEAYQYLVPPECLPDDEGRRRVELLESAEARAEAQELYGRWARGETGQLARPEGFMDRLTREPGKALFGFRGPSGALEGYALVTYRADVPSRDRYLEVDELVWVTPEARRGLHGWLSSLGDQWRHVLLRALPSHRLGDRLKEPRLPRGSGDPWGLWAGAALLMMGPMFRLLDVERAWARRPVLPGPPLTLALEVRDEQVRENAGRWRLRLEEGRAHAERGQGAADLTLGLDVSALSRLFIAAIPPSAALGAGLLTCDRPDLLSRLDHLLRLPEPWLFDRF